MVLISLVAALIVVGLLLWLLDNCLPMGARIKNIPNGVVVLWLLSAFGVSSGFARLPIENPRF